MAMSEQHGLCHQFNSGLMLGPSSGTIRHVSISVYKNEEDSPSQLYDYGGYPIYKSGCLGVAFPALGYVERYTYTPIKWNR